MPKEKLYLHCKTYNWPQSGGLRGKDQKQQKFYGYMSSLAYKDAKKRAEGLAKHNFILDKELSNEDIMVAHNPQTKEVIHSITGSRFNDPKHRFRDIHTDLGILAGVSSLGKRQKEVGDVISKSQKKYGKSADYVNTGHSKGAKIALDNSRQTGIPAIAYNAGSSPIGALTSRIANLFRPAKKAERVHYTTGKDIISKSEQLLGDTKSIVVPLKKDVSTDLAGLHSIKHFTGQEGNGAPGSGVHKKNIKKNKWLVHVDQIKRKNKGMKYTEILKLASRSYVK